MNDHFYRGTDEEEKVPNEFPVKRRSIGLNFY
jgi:hypothetical protein